jgi:hypothetical protein
VATLRAKTIKYPGAYGLNTLETTLGDELTRFGAVVTNGVVDSSGKLASRRNFARTTTGTFSNTLTAMFTWRQTDGTEVIMSGDNASNVYSGTTSLTLRSSNATVNGDIQFAAFGSNLFMAQAGKILAAMDEDFTAATIVGGASNWTSPNVVMAAYGRVWAADDAAGNNRHTIWWSNLLAGLAWNTGDAGNLNVTRAWPKGQDRIIALAAAFNKVIVFGRKSIILYTMPADNNPATMTRDDVVEDLGCVARDSVQVTDTGIYFLSDNGIYRIDKLAATTALLVPTHISLLYNQDVLDQIASETATRIRSSYYPTEGYYVLSFPTSNVTFCVHTRKKVPVVELPLATRWTNSGRPFYSFTFDATGTWYSGGVNGVHSYTGYTPDGASNNYTLTWTGQWHPFEDESRLKHGKAVTLVLEAASGQTGTFEYRTDYLAGTTNSNSFTCSAEEFAENPGVGNVSFQIGRSFKVIQPSVSFAINGNKVTIHQARIYATPGAVKFG